MSAGAWRAPSAAAERAAKQATQRTAVRAAFCATFLPAVSAAECAAKLATHCRSDNTTGTAPVKTAHEAALYETLNATNFKTIAAALLAAVEATNACSNMSAFDETLDGS